MTKKVISVSEITPVESVASLLVENKIHGVPVVANNKPIGIITETDFFTKGSMRVYLPEYINFLKKDSPIGKIAQADKERLYQFINITAKDIMSQPCVSMNENDEVLEFFTLVKENKIISAPVVDDEGDLVGIITLSDIINLIKL